MLSPQHPVEPDSPAAWLLPVPACWCCTTVDPRALTSNLSGFQPRAFAYGRTWSLCLSELNQEGNVLFNDALNTLYLRLYGVRHMVKDHSDSERGNIDYSYWLTARVLLYAPSHRQDSTYHSLYFTCTSLKTGQHTPQQLIYTSCGEQALISNMVERWKSYWEHGSTEAFWSYNACTISERSTEQARFDPDEGRKEMF